DTAEALGASYKSIRRAPVSCTLGLPLSPCIRHALSPRHRFRDEPTTARYLPCQRSSRFRDGYPLATSLAPPTKTRCASLDLATPSLPLARASADRSEPRCRIAPNGGSSRWPRGPMAAWRALSASN